MYKFSKPDIKINPIKKKIFKIVAITYPLSNTVFLFKKSLLFLSNFNITIGQAHDSASPSNMITWCNYIASIYCYLIVSTVLFRI